ELRQVLVRQRLDAERQAIDSGGAQAIELRARQVVGVGLDGDLELVGARREGGAHRGDDVGDALVLPQARRAAAEVDADEAPPVEHAGALGELFAHRRRILFVRNARAGVDREVAIRTSFAAVRKMDINAEHSMQPQQIYLDNGATTRVDEPIAEAAMEAMLVAWGNPSSAHKLGAEAARRVQRAREQVAASLGGAPGEVTFTSG